MGNTHSLLKERVEAKKKIKSETMIDLLKTNVS